MPTYTYKCSFCGKEKEVISSMKNVKKPICCHKPMGRNYRIDLANVGNKEYAKPIHSDSLGIMPNQRAEHQRVFPDVKLDNENRPVFENYRQHDDYLKKTGFVKLKQRKKRKATRLV